GCTLPTGSHARCTHRIEEPRLERNHEAKRFSPPCKKRWNWPGCVWHRKPRPRATADSGNFSSMGDFGNVLNVGVTIASAATQTGIADMILTLQPVAAIRCARTVRAGLAMGGNSPKKINTHRVTPNQAASDGCSARCLWISGSTYSPIR